MKQTKLATWSTPKLDVLSTQRTMAGGLGPNDVFHTANSDDQPQPSGPAPGVS